MTNHQSRHKSKKRIRWRIVLDHTNERLYKKYIKTRRQFTPQSVTAHSHLKISDGRQPMKPVLFQLKIRLQKKKNIMRPGRGTTVKARKMKHNSSEERMNSEHWWFPHLDAALNKYLFLFLLTFNIQYFVQCLRKISLTHLLDPSKIY